MDLRRVGSTQVDEPGLNQGLALPFHMAVNHCIRVASNVRKDGIWSLGLIVLLSHHVVAKKVRSMSALMSDY